MSQPTEFEIRQADLARKARDKGYTLLARHRFSLFKDGASELEPEDFETLDDVEHYLETH